MSFVEIRVDADKITVNQVDGHEPLIATNDGEIALRIPIGLAAPLLEELKPIVRGHLMEAREAEAFRDEADE